MTTEELLRRPDYRRGVMIRLADGQLWSFPTPMPKMMAAPDGHLEHEKSNPVESDLLDLLLAIREAEDRAEALRAELALAIHLLQCNYDLGADDYRRLLDFEPGNPELTRVQQAFHEVARLHFEHIWPRTEVRTNRRRFGNLIHSIRCIRDRLRGRRSGAFCVPGPTEPLSSQR